MSISKFKIFLLLLIPTTLFGRVDATSAYGSYLGNGAASQVISGLGIDPDVVLIKGDGAHEAWMATSSMTAGKAKRLNSALVLSDDLMHTDGLGTGQFTVGTNDDANKTGVTYYYIAFIQTTDVRIGSYVGTPGGYTYINTGAAGAPDILWILPDEANASSFGNAARATISGKFTLQDNAGQTEVYSFTVTGFTHGTSNDQVETYHYVAFNADTDGSIRTFKFTGNETDGNAITGIGFEPDFVMPLNTNHSGPVCFKTAAMPGTYAAKVSAVALETDLITSFDADGFTLGADPDANHSAGGDWNAYFATKGGTLLPVELTSFSAKKTGEVVEIKWGTASEINSKIFIVERSIDGINFEEILETRGAGNASESQFYQEIDFFPNEGVNYYRLKQIDYNGAYEYFRTVAIMFSSDNKIDK